MLRWAHWLGAIAPGLQRLIASRQRISLPRGCTPDERLTRLRAALCRPAAVRAVYFTLTADEQAALQALRQIPRGLTAEALARRYGPIRPLTALRAAPQPQSLSERLVLLGWLLPRPAARNHPVRYLLAPELRAWLPVSLPPAVTPPPSPDHGPTPPLPLALIATTALLSLAAASPLALRADGTPTATTLRALQRRLPPLPTTELGALMRWLVPVLTQAGLLAPHGQKRIPSPAAARFLDSSPTLRVQRLTTAWLAVPSPDRWLVSLRVNQRGLDWLALRRRLLAWAEVATASATLSYAELAAALGPLADGVTHGVATPRRRNPWTPRRAAEVWQAALRGPLAWLGYGNLHNGGERNKVVADRPVTAWLWRDDQTLWLPAGVGEADRLGLAPFAARVEATADGELVTLHARGLARAVARGYDLAPLRTVLLNRCGGLPAPLEALLTPAGGLRLVQQTLVLSDDPAVLNLALRRRSARRAVQTRLAPGVALVAPGAETRLVRALARDGRRLTPPLPRSNQPPTGLTAGEAARLVLAAAFYTAYAPPDAPPGPTPDLAARLLAGLEAPLRATMAQLLEDLPQPLLPSGARSGSVLLGAQSGTGPLAARPPDPTPGAPADRNGSAQAAPVIVPLADQLVGLRQAVRRRQMVELTYQGANDPAPRLRLVRPLRLERHANWWYLQAYCVQSRAERCFRLDRVSYLRIGANQPEGERSTAQRPLPAEPGPTPEPAAQQRHVQRGAAGAAQRARVGFFAHIPRDAATPTIWLGE